MKDNYKMTFKRISAVLLSFALLFVTVTPGSVFATEKLLPSKVMAYHKPNVTILFNEMELGFVDVNKKPVYPIIYNGSTYIPLRGVSALMGENIEWEPLSQIVFIGKTLSHPYKGANARIAPNSGALVPFLDRPEETVITVYSKPDVIIMYDFELQTFEDVSGMTVYPIIFNGSTYLPVRAVSKLIGATIKWDSNNQIVSISKETDIPETKSEATLALSYLFNQAVEFYNQATAKILTLKSTEDPLVMLEIAEGISLDYKRAQENQEAIKAMDKTKYTDAEKIANDKLQAFLELAEYYTLVLENISYMAVNGEDYSMFEEVFLTFSLETTAKMDEARSAIESL